MTWPPLFLCLLVVSSLLRIHTLDLVQTNLLKPYEGRRVCWFSFRVTKMISHIEKIGVKNAVFIAIFGYAFATFLAFFMESRIHFFCLAALIGIFQGGIQALSRSLFTRLIPKNREAEFFGCP